MNQLCGHKPSCSQHVQVFDMPQLFLKKTISPYKLVFF
jgi:hypothetical protein